MSTRSPFHRVIGPVIVVGMAVSCGSGGGGRALSAAGDVLSRAISGSGSADESPAWSENRAGCAVFQDHRTACPPLRNCHALMGKRVSMTVNVCVDEQGELDAVQWCRYHGGYWCRAPALPTCAATTRWACDDLAWIVCEDEQEEQRILRRHVDSVSGRCSYELAERIDARVSDGTGGLVGTDAGETAGWEQGADTDVIVGDGGPAE